MIRGKMMSFVAYNDKLCRFTGAICLAPHRSSFTCIIISDF